MAQTLLEKGVKVEHLLASIAGRANAKAATSHGLWMLMDTLEPVTLVRLDQIENQNFTQRVARLGRVRHEF